MDYILEIEKIIEKLWGWHETQPASQPTDSADVCDCPPNERFYPVELCRKCSKIKRKGRSLILMLCLWAEGKNMNNQLQAFARQNLKDGLAQLPENNQMLFKRMYSHENLDADISDVVDSMPDDKLDWAMQQVERSLGKQA